MSNFMEGLKSTLNDERSVTENGAVGFRTTGRSLLDLNFAVASLRSASKKDIYDRFSKAFFEDKLTAMKWLFYARDVRGGLGERRLFRACMVPMAKGFPEYVRPVVKLIPEYGRWDDLWCLLDTPVADEVKHCVSMQLTEDNHFYEQNQPISLLAKWMPRCKCRNKDRRRYATMLREYLNLTERDYQHTLSALCRHLKVVEMDMSAQNWDGIDYQRVPSRANLQYNSAFLRHDEDRRRAFLAAVEKGDAKINASVLFPHDIVHRYYRAGYGVDSNLEMLWKNLPDMVQGCGNTIVVADSSGSMTTTVGGTDVSALEVANALAIYFAERSSGQFKDRVAPTATLFEVIAKRYADAGYQLPRLVFWNVNSRTGTIPVKENDLGVALVSGFSPNVAKMVMSGKLDPYDCLLEAVNAERYQLVDDVLRPVIFA